MKRDPLLLDGFFFIVVTLIGIVVGLHTLVDADLGWHLTGGLWILESGQIPKLDFIGAQHNFWLCYSWLVEVCFAIVYRMYGFSGLQCLQVIAVVACVWLLVWILRRLVTLAAPTKDFLRLRLCENLGMFILILFVVPVWHLRPQLFSVMLFAFTVYLAETKALSIGKIICLGVLWANIHVYWLFLPLVVFAYRVFEPTVLQKKLCPSGFLPVGAALLTGFVNPYGIGFLEGLTTYAFDHSAARVLISEFQPLSVRHGYILWLFIFVWGLFLFARKEIQKRESSGLLFLIVVFSLGSLQQLKFIPLFGVVASIALARTVIPALLFRHERDEFGFTPEPRLSSQQKVFASSMLLVFSIVCGFSLEMPEPVEQDKRELLNLVRDLIVEKKIVAKSATNVLSHFDDGGWLSLAFWQMRPKGKLESPFKLAIDGRTLVVGEERLKDFQQLRRLEGDWCSVLDRWKVTLAILPAKFQLATALTGEYAPQFFQPCSGRWKTIVKTKEWMVLEFPEGKEKPKALKAAKSS